MDAFDRNEKTWKDLDFEQVNHESSTVSDDPEAGHWYWGRGGSPLGDREWSISRVDDDLKETRYKMPDCINKMLDWRKEEGVKEARRDIKGKLGCYDDNKCPLNEDEDETVFNEDDSEDKVTLTFSRIADLNFTSIYSSGFSYFLKEKCEEIVSIDELLKIISQILESESRFARIFMGPENFSAFRRRHVEKFINVYDVTDHRNLYGYVKAERGGEVHGIAIFVNRVCRDKIYIKVE